MKYEMALRHANLSRRDALKFGAASAAGAAAMVALPGAAGAETDADALAGSGVGSPNGVAGSAQGKYNDDMFDVEAAKAGAWAPSRYGAGDQRGAFNELTPRRTARALKLLNLNRAVKTYQMGEEMFNGFPAFPSDPPRLHDMYAYALGFDAGPEFAAGGGVQATTDALGSNELIGFEERFAENFTFQIATQIDGLNHIGIGETFYNGFNAHDIATPTGTTALGNETMGPVVTRGVIIDVVGLKVANGDTDAYFTTPEGKHVLVNNYRITIDDIEKAMYRQRVRRKLGPGDVPILHTGWTHLARTDPDLYLSGEPGIFRAEAHYFADKRVALVASDTWGLETLDPALTGDTAFTVHHLLITKHGIRIGESFVSDAAIADHAYDGVLIATPENVPGATCGSSPPAFMAQTIGKPRS